MRAELSGMGQDGSTSTSLLHRSQAREPDAWERLVSLYTPLVRHWCRQAGASAQDIADISQDIFATVSTKLPTFRADRPGTTFRAWMRGVARLKLMEHVRHRGQPAVGGTSTRKRLEQVAAPPDLLELSEGPDELTQLCQRALTMVRHEFEERTWTAFWRVAVEEQATADVATESGISPAAVRQAKSRILRRLKEEIGELTA
jgi:RNA polymerase sigma-70 factor, ECF subfamily